jgi:SAM-dependent methyltransferase
MNHYFEQLLNAYWLRPETALWRSIDIQTMRDFQFQSPSLDLGCGDGIFSFIRAGGQFDITFDAFQAVSNLDSFFDKVDIFDSFDTSLCPVVIKKGDYQIDYAFDHKKNLLRKAKTLGLHKNFIVGDANKRLPFEDKTFNTVFSNIIYWLDDPKSTFVELARVLKLKGRCCVMLPNRAFPEYSFYYDLYVKQKNNKFQFLEKLDRGRITDNIKHAKGTDEWTKMIESSGLTVVMHTMHLSKTTIQIWDVGLRPLFPILYKMISELSKETVMEIKKQWVDIFSTFLKPIAEMDSELNKDIEPGFHCFILEK